MTRIILLLLLQLYGWLGGSCVGQHSGYSLQAAVDELHRREAAKYPLNAAPPTQQHFGNGAFLGASPPEQDYWDDDPEETSSSTRANNNNNSRNRHRLNKILAKYLERENYDADHGGLTLGPFGGYEFDADNNKLFVNYPEDKKRASYFRERDNKWINDNTPIFREHDATPTNGDEHAELTDQFLREIEESQELERETRYKDALRRLWEKYQQQENELDGNLHEEYKRMISNPNFYMGPLMQKKRSYPVLPWLPYTRASRKKRVPASVQASPVKRSSNDNIEFGKTNEKVAWELSELFGEPVADDKKKRSTDDHLNIATTLLPEKPNSINDDSANDSSSATQQNSDNSSLISDGSKNMQQQQRNGKYVTEKYNDESVVGDHASQQKINKRSNDHHMHDVADSHENCDESEEDNNSQHDQVDEEDDNDNSDEHNHDDGEEEEEEDEHHDHDIEKRKKKRDTTTTTGEEEQRAHRMVNKVDQMHSVIPIRNFRRKKSIDWSKYFGLDRKRNLAQAGDHIITDGNNEAENIKLDDKQSKYNFDPEKLNNMDKKLQAIEDLIIDDTIKYTGAHEGVASSDDIRQLKEHVLSRLATAYSLEKMRRALEKLRQSVDTENHLLRNVIESDSKSRDGNTLQQQKRISVKKEKVQYDNQHSLDLSPSIEKSHDVNSNSMSSSNANTNNSHSEGSTQNEEEDMMKKKKKKKRNGYLRYPELTNTFDDVEPETGAGHYESLNDAYLGNKNYIFGSHHCPIIESMAERCANVDLLSGDMHQSLLPICGIHQICYLCGTSQVSCDYQYLTEADAICGRNNDCQTSARSVLMVLRGTAGPHLGPKQCLKNPCLYSAMREIGL